MAIEKNSLAGILNKNHSLEMGETETSSLGSDNTESNFQRTAFTKTHALGMANPKLTH